MGLLSPSDIVSWSFTINRGTAGSLGPYTYTGSNLTSGTLSPGMAQMILVGGPVATPTQLVLYGDYQSVSQGYFDGCELGLYYGIDSGDIYAANLNYFNSPGYYEHYLGTIDTTGAVSIAGWNTVSPEMNGSQPWVIATATPTPEPSTLLLLAASATSLVGYGFWRRRVTKRTAKPAHFDQPQENDPTILSFPSHSFHEATVNRVVLDVPDELGCNAAIGALLSRFSPSLASVVIAEFRSVADVTGWIVRANAAFHSELD